MKKSLIILAVLALFCGLGQAQTTEKVSSYGEKITADNAIESTTISERLKGQDSLRAKVAGTVASVCQKKGCWLKMDAGDGQTMMVRFYDYGFFVPMDCEGKKIILDGTATITKITVEELRHYAHDAGKSDEEIKAINSPETQISFEATGVLLYND